MKPFKMDLKFNKIKQLADIFKQEKIKDHGIYHIQRNIIEVSKDELLLIASYDLNNMFTQFSKGDITHITYCEQSTLKILSITVRLETQSILKLVITSGTGLDNRLRLNFSVKGRVFKYDDANAYLNSTLNLNEDTHLKHNDETKLVLAKIEEALYD